MPYDVTSSFVSQSRQRTPDVVRQFTIGSSDYSERVLQWPKFNRVWDEIRPRTLRIRLANGDQGMNFLRDDKTLLENQATIKMGFGNENLLTYSEQFDHADWTKGDVSITANAITAPDGTLTADKIETTTAANPHVRNGPVSFTPDVSYTGAVWIKGGNISEAEMIFWRFGDAAGPVTIESASIISGPGAVTGVGTNIATVTGLSVSEWTKIAIGGKPSASDGALKLYIKNRLSGATIGDYNYIWGAQLSQSDKLLPYSMTTNILSPETIDLFTGKMRGVSYADEKCTLSIVDKFQQLSERKVGTSDEPIEYVGSNYLPSDIAWWAVTSFGGYDTTASSANTDIDYSAFQDWAKIFSQDTVFINARFDGQKCTEVLRKIARHTHSAIFIKENKLSFHRFGIADANVSSFGPEDLLDVALSFDTSDIINRQFVSGDYDVASKFHKFTVLDQKAASVNSFGPKENILKDDNVWYVDSASAINLAQRLILANADPDDSLKVRAGLVGLPRLIGETLMVLDAFHGITESYRVLEHSIDMDKGITEFRIDRTQLTNAFILDTSSLDGSDVLT